MGRSKGYAWVVEIRVHKLGLLKTDWGPYSIFDSRSKAREAAKLERRWGVPWNKFRVVKYVRIRGKRFRWYDDQTCCVRGRIINEEFAKEGE